MNISQKDLNKNRRGFIRYLYSLKSRWEQDLHCVYCAKAQAVLFCTGKRRLIGFDGNIPIEVKQQLDFTSDQYYEMERRFESWSKKLDEHGSMIEFSDNFKAHDFKEIAEWCQTLPGWPTVI